jgi:hypothetical protein
MPKFYFDLVNAEGGRITDMEGADFDNLEAAKADALHALGAMGTGAT